MPADRLPQADVPGGRAPRTVRVGAALLHHRARGVQAAALLAASRLFILALLRFKILENQKKKTKFLCIKINIGLKEMSICQHVCSSTLRVE